MPHIFPRRFLRTRDVLDPSDFNEDFHPVYDTLQGRLDRTNFNAADLKANLRPHPDSSATFTTGLTSDRGPSVAEGAYFKTHVSQVESRFEVWESNSASASRVPLNFVEPDGSTFRDIYEFTGSSPNAYPSIIPNHGAWSAVKNEDLSDSQKLTFKTGHAKIWVSAYAQYIWQGFFEYKKPWIPGNRRYSGADLHTPDPPNSWAFQDGSFQNESIATREREVLNLLGPSKTHESLPTPTSSNIASKVQVYDEPFAFPLNERQAVYTTKNDFADEVLFPHKNGYHHISRGFNPCLVQFAIRLDGKIIEETITGKRMPFEESPHGLRVDDSPRTTSQDEIEAATFLNLLGETADYSALEHQTGQRSFSVKSTLGESGNARPGQKIKTSRAVSYGPEVMPVRLGTVLEVQPGEHTIELCVRRLQRKKGKFKVGDFVGVFSRRLVAFELPIHPLRTPTDEGGLDTFTIQTDPMSKIPAFKAETELRDANVSNVRSTLSDQINNIPDEALDDEVLSNRYLPSKVVFAETSTITPTYTVDEFTGIFGSASKAPSTEAIFPGYKHGDALSNNVVAQSKSGWRLATGDLLSTSRMGWLQLQMSEGADKLSVTPPVVEGVLRPNEQLILMMDVELKGIQPLYSDDGLDALQCMTKFTDPQLLREIARDYLRYCLAERYLDLFAMFAIGYKEDGSWIVSTDAAPSVVNSFNWINRHATFDCSSHMADLPIARLGSKNFWDHDPRWTGLSGVFFNDDQDDEYYIASGTKTGGNLLRSNLGVNVPIMTVIENTGTTNRTITEFGGFACTMVPSIWTKGHGLSNPRQFTEALTPEEKAVGHLFDEWLYPIHRAWTSPVGGRNILKGVKVHFGNARLTAIKVKK